MTKYSKQIKGDGKVAKASGNNVRVSFKSTFATAAAIRGMNLKKAQKYLNAVIAREDVIPIRRYNGHVSRTAQAKKHGCDQGRWPVKAVKIVLDLLKNAESNAEAQAIDTEDLTISHIQVNHAPDMRRRTYRAHGRINAYNTHPAHIELLLAKKGDVVANGASEGVAGKGNKLAAGVSAASL